MQSVHVTLVVHVYEKYGTLCLCIYEVTFEIEEAHKKLALS